MSTDRKLQELRTVADEWERERRAWNLPSPKRFGAAVDVRRPADHLKRGVEAALEPAVETVEEAARA